MIWSKFPVLLLNSLHYGLKSQFEKISSESKAMVLIIRSKPLKVSKLDQFHMNNTILFNGKQFYLHHTQSTDKESNFVICYLASPKCTGFSTKFWFDMHMDMFCSKNVSIVVSLRNQFLCKCFQKILSQKKSLLY